ncbi:MAG: STAS domain-containing protein [Candidatus Eisenbacteria bacterium]|uniref:STAS domain-containing protein n=1 Tax=Eiseniibacteriota bacterium TaxID=2212470 RepID=A0A538SHY8_UNCEI|nr:MAG: STAS domain-containing protein [Candidatus Eisenbacteria bacterium]
MKGLQIERIGPADDFHFSFKGVVDPDGARKLDRLLLKCQGKSARRVRLDFSGVESVSSLGLSVLSRWGKVYEGTDRRIEMNGASAELRASLQSAGAIIYIANAPGSPPASAEAPKPRAAEPDSEKEHAHEKGTHEKGVPGPHTHEKRAHEKSEEPAREAPKPSDAPVGPEMASLQTKLKRKIVEFRNLFEITQALNLAQDLDEVMNLFGLSVMGQFGLERLALFLSDPDKDGHLIPRHVRGFPQHHFQDFVIPWTAFRRFGPDKAFMTLQELETKHTGSDELEALRETGFEWAVLLWVRRDLEGVLFVSGRGGGRKFTEDDRDLLTILAHQGAVAISNARVQRAQEERNLGLVRGMMALIESRDGYAKGSTERVVRYVSAVARLLDYPKEHLKSLVYGAVLRDIGMITVSGLILKNPAHLSEEEWGLIKQHPVRGEQILEEMNFPKEVIAIVLNHHERWGGEGYPNGIRGQEIPLGARIVSLVDAYVAMTSERPYRRALPYEKARQVIAENWGSPFDPSVIEIFLSVLDKIERRSRLRTGQPLTSGSAPAAGTAASPGSAAVTDHAVGAIDPLASGATIPGEGKGPDDSSGTTKSGPAVEANRT